MGKECFAAFCLLFLLLLFSVPFFVAAEMEICDQSSSLVCCSAKYVCETDEDGDVTPNCLYIVDYNNCGGCFPGITDSACTCYGSCSGGTSPLNICGDGIVQQPNSYDFYEVCDDGNGYNNDDCVNCENAYCGDGSLRIGYEGCDYGSQNGVVCTPNYGSSSYCYWCSSDCVRIKEYGDYCGDGEKNGYGQCFGTDCEQCDGDDLGGATCSNIGSGFTGGSLSCYPQNSDNQCEFNTLSCNENPPNTPPSIYETSPSTPINIDEGSSVTFQAKASDSDSFSYYSFDCKTSVPGTDISSSGFFSSPLEISYPCIYTSSGSYTARFLVKDNSSEQLSSHYDWAVNVNKYPNVNIMNYPESVEVYHYIPFTFHGSLSDNDGVIEYYAWYCTNSPTPSGTSPSSSGSFGPSLTIDWDCTYSGIGSTYTLRLMAQDNKGAETSDYITVSVVEPENYPPVWSDTELSLTTNEDSLFSETINLRDYVEDIDTEDSDENLVFSFYFPPNGGAVAGCVLVDGYIFKCYTPNPDYNTYNRPQIYQKIKVTDSYGNAAYKNIYLIINPVNDPPVAVISSPSATDSFYFTQSIFFDARNSYDIDSNDAGTAPGDAVTQYSWQLNPYPGQSYPDSRSYFSKSLSDILDGETNQIQNNQWTVWLKVFDNYDTPADSTTLERTFNVYYCGDDFFQQGYEQCDGTQTTTCQQLELPTDNTVFCNSDCSWNTTVCVSEDVPFCGNNDIDDGEECDDGNTASCDGCSASCEIEACGNNRIDCGEDCDGNTGFCADLGLGFTGGSLSCDDFCRWNMSDCNSDTGVYCGDGLVNQEWEQCDDGNSNNNDACVIDYPNNHICKFNVCGDGYLFPFTEECDDDNNINGDGCDAFCRSENPCQEQSQTCGYFGGGNCCSGLSCIGIINGVGHCCPTGMFWDSNLNSCVWQPNCEAWEAGCEGMFSGDCCPGLQCKNAGSSNSKRCCYPSEVWGTIIDGSSHCCKPEASSCGGADYCCGSNVCVGATPLSSGHCCPLGSVWSDGHCCPEGTAWNPELGPMGKCAPPCSCDNPVRNPSFEQKDRNSNPLYWSEFFGANAESYDSIAAFDGRYVMKLTTTSINGIVVSDEFSVNNCNFMDDDTYYTFRFAAKTGNPGMSVGVNAQVRCYDSNGAVVRDFPNIFALSNTDFWEEKVFNLRIFEKADTVSSLDCVAGFQLFSTQATLYIDKVIVYPVGCDVPPQEVCSFSSFWTGPRPDANGYSEISSADFSYGSSVSLATTGNAGCYGKTVSYEIIGNPFDGIPEYENLGYVWLPLEQSSAVMQSAGSGSRVYVPWIFYVANPSNLGLAGLEEGQVNPDFFNPQCPPSYGVDCCLEIFECTEYCKVCNLPASNPYYQDCAGFCESFIGGKNFGLR